MSTKTSSQRTQDSRSWSSAASFAGIESKDVPMPGQPVNLLLAMLKPAYRTALLARLKPVSLLPREVLYEADETPVFAHFMTSGIASVVASMTNGTSAEVGIWGKEGLVESLHLLGNARIPTRC